MSDTTDVSVDVPGQQGVPAEAVPEVSVPRYLAPRVHVTSVAEVISPEPTGGRARPGHYQRVLLNTRTGELSFHESTEHLETWEPSWTAINDVPRETWKRWHPGKLFGAGPHMWFDPVPELLCWVIDSGVTEFPYLDVGTANRFLAELVPYAQALLDALFDVSDLDWSASSARAGRDIERMCSRDRRTVGRSTDAGLADYGEIVQRFPAVYRPDLLRLAPDKLARECEAITRFLGCNEHWHPEVKESFGTPYPDGSGLSLDILGVRSWYRAAAGIGGTPVFEGIAGAGKNGTVRRWLAAFLRRHPDAEVSVVDGKSTDAWGQMR
jgi:hypothetical protein